MTEPWTPLDDAAYTAIWDRFELAFDFHPSVDSQHWPGIREPAPSITYDISWVHGHPDAEALEAELDEKVIEAFRRCVRPNDRVFALDWQHDSYSLDPHV